MNSLWFYIKYLRNNPKDFYLRWMEVIAGFLLRFYICKNNSSINDINRNWKAYSYLYKKYNNLIQSLPLYKEDDSKEDIIWWCRLQWYENAPKLNKSCLASVRKFVKNKKIVVITYENLDEYVKFPKYIYDKHDKGVMPHAHFSDLVRLELLINYWGTWIDSSVLLTWYEKTFFDSDFFVFNNFHRGDESIALSNWFITSNKNNPILKTTRDLLFEYWKRNNYLVNYYIFHMFFTMATKKYSEVWDKVPKYSNLPPHIMQYEFLEKYDEERFEELKKISSVHKLSQKVDRRKLSKNSLFEYIENM